MIHITHSGKVKRNKRVKRKPPPATIKKRKKKTVRIKPLKRILIIYPKGYITRGNFALHTQWVDECRDIFIIDFWGPGWGEISIISLSKKIDIFKPDYIYLTIRSRYRKWLPDLLSIKVPKIYVEVDTCYYKANDNWYKQFDQLYCRSHAWSNWNDIPILEWSVPEVIFPKTKQQRKGIYFVGTYRKKLYNHRCFLREQLKGLVEFKRISSNFELNLEPYYSSLRQSSALLCPTENKFGNYIPAKFFEYMASGAAVLTNCDIINSNIPELNDIIIKYNSLEDLKYKLKNTDFIPYHNKGVPIMKKYTHKEIYKKLFI